MEKFLDFIKKYKYLILSGIVILLIVVGGILVYVFKDGKEENNNNENIVSIIKEQEQVENQPEIVKEENITVDVKGEVINPGVYKLPVGSRVIDAIEISGGVTKRADTSMLNLSKVLSDENVIVVGNKYSTQTVKYIEKECNCPSSNDVCVNDDTVIGTSNESNKNENTKISINKASKEELMNLSGIGESKALDIIDYRSKNGLFKSIEDLKQVSGIGDKLFEKIKDQITM